MVISKETVLYYYPEQTEEVSKAKMVFALMGIRIKNISAGQFTQSVGFLAGQGGEKKPEPEESPFVKDSIMVFCGFSEGRLDALLLHLKKAGVSSAGYKAMLTPTNADWSFGELYEELQKERKAIEERKRNKDGQNS